MKKPFEVLFLLIAAFLLINCGGGGGGGGGAAAPSTTSTNETTATTTSTTTPTSTLAAPTIQVPTGKALLSGSKIGITTSVAGAAIYYTLDGTEPTSSSSVYTSSKVTINSACTLKAIAIKDSEFSTVASASYSIAARKNTPDAVNDIVFKDGSAIAYTANLYVTEEFQSDFQSNAVAMIFYKGTDCSNDGSTRTLGVGLKRSPSYMHWCLHTANGYAANITTIQCTPSGSAGTYTFTGDKNGSDNLLQIASFLAGNNDTGTAGNYPAFEYAKNYGSTNGCSGAYANGWYLPSIAELYQIYNQKVSIDLAITLCGWANTFSNTFFWSSTQYGSSNWVAYSLNVYNGAFGGVEKESTSMTSYPLCVCAIREF